MEFTHLNFMGKIDLLTGTGLSDLWYKNPEENVAAEYEDQADCFGNSDSVDPHHSPLYLPRVQLWKKISCFLPVASVLFIKTCNYISRENIIYVYVMTWYVVQSSNFQILGTK